MSKQGKNKCLGTSSSIQIIDELVPTKKIYIKTDLKEMPKSCKECDIKLFDIESEWSIRDAHCFYRETLTTNRDCRPLWCPLVRKE